MGSIAEEKESLTIGEQLKKAGIPRREFLEFCTKLMIAAPVGLAITKQAWAGEVADELAKVRRPSVVWLEFQDCTGCTETLLRTSRPSVDELIFNVISLDYHETLMPGAGKQAEQALHAAVDGKDGKFFLVCEGSIPTKDNGDFLKIAGKKGTDLLQEVGSKAAAIIAMGSCASWGCVQAAKPNPTQATPIHKVITDKPIVRVPGCPPIPEVMTGVVTYMLTFDRLPDVDAQGRPKMFYSQRVHDKCYRRPHFDAGQFAEKFDDAGARMGYCLYKVGCKGPVTYNACSATRWNEGLSFPIQSGHGCIGCSEDAFWDKGSFYDHLTTIKPPGLSGIEGTADQIGLGVAAVAGAAVAVHAAVSAIKQARSKSRNDKVSEVEE